MIVAREIIRKSEDRNKDLICLASADTGLTLAGIRSAVRQDNGRIPPYLKLMTDRKLIRKDGKTPRGGIYSISDSPFKLWLRIEIVGKA